MSTKYFEVIVKKGLLIIYQASMIFVLSAVGLFYVIKTIDFENCCKENDNMKKNSALLIVGVAGDGEDMSDIE